MLFHWEQTDDFNQILRSLYDWMKVIFLTIVQDIYQHQWRIQDFPQGGANSQNCYYFSHFCRKLHENERIWTPGGARPWGPPLDPPMSIQWLCVGDSVSWTGGVNN